MPYIMKKKQFQKIFSKCYNCSCLLKLIRIKEARGYITSETKMYTLDADMAVCLS